MPVKKGNEITLLMKQIENFKQGGFETKEELELRLKKLLSQADSETLKNVWK